MVPNNVKNDKFTNKFSKCSIVLIKQKAALSAFNSLSLKKKKQNQNFNPAIVLFLNEDYSFD
jgi:hypothetical protein